MPANALFHQVEEDMPRFRQHKPKEGIEDTANDAPRQWSMQLHTMRNIHTLHLTLIASLLVEL